MLDIDTISQPNHGSPMASNGLYGGAAPAGGAPLPHVDDLTAAPTDINPNQSLKRLLEQCESSLRSAEMSREFRRPATALKDYIRAYVIAVHTVRGHRDYPTMQTSGRGELSKKHSSLLKEIEALYHSYNEVKALIRKDNERTGVKRKITNPSSSPPAAAAESNGVPEGQHRDGAQPNGSSQPPVNGSPVKAKPAPRPKPQSLHGNAIQNHARSLSTTKTLTGADSLAARFAGLGGPTPSQGQDPRIKTHSFSNSARPAGPREMPGTAKAKIGVDSSVPTLPKVPDAIYSPVRGNMSEESARMPTSTPRGTFTRTGSSTSVAATPSASSQAPSKDYFTPTYTTAVSADPGSFSRPSMDLSSTVSSPKRSLDLSSRDVIEPIELYHAMKEKGSFLLIDVRNREDFDDGHINSTSTICIEPSVLARENLSANDIAESLVISPNQEQQLFERRNEYDLVVIYDQDSREIPKYPQGQDEMALVSLHRALIHLNYGCDLKHPPRLLKGGLDAWVDLMGEKSLQTTSASAHLRNGAVGRRRSKYRLAQMKADEVRAWQETMRNDDMETASSPTLYRTQEDFMRRFPAVPIEPEDMRSPAPPARPEKRPLGNWERPKQHAVGDLPAPLARPAPAVSRPSHSGLSMGADNQGTYDDKSGAAVQAPGRAPRPPEQPNSYAHGHYTGLNNPANWCYANSFLQSLLVCDLGKELSHQDWKNNYKVPKRPNERIEQPQLMMSILSNLYHWMTTGKFEVMKASTLMGYTRDLCIKTSSQEVFGDDSQHDAQEFMSFLLTHLDDETNIYRDRKGHAAQPDTRGQSLRDAAMAFWDDHSRYHRSIVDRYWRLIELGITECTACRNMSYNFRAVDMITPSIGDADMTLENALTKHMEDNDLSDYQCDSCKKRQPAKTRLCYPRMPSLLCVGFNRFGFTPDRGSTKSTATITWDLNDLDMTPYFLRPDACHTSRSIDDKGFEGRFRYECFAVVEHAGRTAHSGHYTAYVRDKRTHDPSAWLYCDDSRVQRVRMDNPDVRRRLFKDRDRVPYLAFFRKKDGS